MWMLVRGFQNDIRMWVDRRIGEKLDELREAAANFGPRVQRRTREKNQRDIERYERERGRIGAVPSFTYGTGSNYSKGLLGHDDVLKIATEFLSGRQLFRTLLAQQFPFVFVDESQDTTAGVVQALKAVELQMRGKFCLGFFGDPMQRIYPTGVGTIAAEDGWLNIPKPENFRCATSVLNVRTQFEGMATTSFRRADAWRKLMVWCSRSQERPASLCFQLPAIATSTSNA